MLGTATGPHLEHQSRCLPEPFHTAEHTSTVCLNHILQLLLAVWQHQGQCKATWASATPAMSLTARAGGELRGMAALSLDEGVSLLLLDVVQRGFPLWRWEILEIKKLRSFQCTSRCEQKFSDVPRITNSENRCTLHRATLHRMEPD